MALVGGQDLLLFFAIFYESYTLISVRRENLQYLADLNILFKVFAFIFYNLIWITTMVKGSLERSIPTYC